MVLEMTSCFLSKSVYSIHISFDDPSITMEGPPSVGVRWSFQKGVIINRPVVKLIHQDASRIGFTFTFYFQAWEDISIVVESGGKMTFMLLCARDLTSCKRILDTVVITQ